MWERFFLEARGMGGGRRAFSEKKEEGGEGGMLAVGDEMREARAQGSEGRPREGRGRPLLFLL